MRRAHAVGGAWQMDGATNAVGKRNPEQPDPLGPFGDDCRAEPRSDGDAENCQDRAAVGHVENAQRHQGGEDISHPEALQRAQDIAAFPGQHRSNTDGDDHGRHQRHEGAVEKGEAHRQLRAVHRVQKQWVERSQKHRGTAAGQQKIVQDQRTLPRYRGEQAAALQFGRAHGE